MEEEKLDQMFDFLKNKMVFEKWYPISQQARAAIKHCADLGIIDECEFNNDLTKIRKIDI